MNKQVITLVAVSLVLAMAFQAMTQTRAIQSNSAIDGWAQVVIGLDNSRSDALDEILLKIDEYGGRVIDSVTAAVGKIAVVANFPANTIQAFSVEMKAARLARYVEPTQRLQIQFMPDDPYWLYQWGLQKIQADSAWDTTVGNHSLLVATVDTGIDYTHPDLAVNFAPLGYNWVSSNTNTLDDNGHGTHVAGIIAAATNNGIGIAGIANVSLMAEKSFDAAGSANDTDAANGIIHAVDQGARIISNSWGGDQDSSIIHDAVKYAYDHGALVLAAAGNGASGKPMYPAAYPEVIGVTATDVTDSLADFSSFGDWVEVAAPGVNIYSTLPTYSATLTSQPYLGYGYLSGTSMACPHATGVAALIWSQFSNASRDWIRAKLRYTSVDLGSPGFDPLYGYGRINASSALDRPPANNVLVFDFQEPDHIQAETNVSSQITIMNFGTSDEVNVTIELLANNTVVGSGLIPFLQSEKTASLNVNWTPTVGGKLNVTAYVVPVPGEMFVSDNVISRTVSVMQIILNPAQGPIGTKVTANGVGFSSGSRATLSFNDVFMGNVTSDDQGDFSFVFNVPLSSAEQQTVKATGIDSELASTNFMTLDTSALSVQVDSGNLHFVGEIVEFYVQTAFKGVPVNATTTSAVLFKPEGTSVALTSQLMITGLQKLVYTIAQNLTGTYALVVAANYAENNVKASGTGFRSFLVSDTFTGMNSQIHEIKENVAILQTDVGSIQLNLTAMNATLDGIFVRVAEINHSTVILETTLGTMHGTITSIHGDVATIKTEIGTINTSVSALLQNQQTMPQEQIAAIIIALVAASIAALALLYTRKKETQYI